MLEQSLVFILFIVAGLLLQRKFNNRTELKGIKLIILNIALPATIFIALMSVSLDYRYMGLPLGAICINVILLAITYFMAPLFGIAKGSSEHRTMMLLIPSLAPGLSCFPFLTEFMGENALALGALADVGNKFYVLIFCYLLALHWYQKIMREESADRGKVKSLLISMLNEPINLVMAVAIVLVIAGWNLTALPEFIQNSFLRASAMMTPLVLLFIGMSVQLKWAEIKKVFSFLVLRSGIAFTLSGIVILLAPGISQELKLLIIVFPQSAVSFWPFAHMSALNKSDSTSVFNMSMAISVIACSLPFSTLTLLGVFSAQEIILQYSWLPIITGLLLITLVLIPLLVRQFSQKNAGDSLLANEPLSMAE